MTDNDIINDLQSVAEWFAEHGRNTNTAVVGISKRAIAEINRQKAEIERLQADGETLAISLLNAKKEIERLEKTLTEAITKFSERLKGDNFKVPVDAFTSAYVLGDDDIDQIAKELKGGGADA